MTMDILRKNFAEFLRGSRIKLEITGFDMDGFEKAMHRELSHRLGMIQGIILEDNVTSTDTEKVAAIRSLFERDFICKE